jgi:hypothetical protein
MYNNKPRKLYSFVGLHGISETSEVQINHYQVGAGLRLMPEGQNKKKQDSAVPVII